MNNTKALKVKILVCCHKPDKWLSNDVYIPIHCGKAVSKVNLGIQGDDTGDNISAKNPDYCELTAMYWAWKNLKDVDYVGLCHYRRYFNFHTKGLAFQEDELVNSERFDDLNLTVPDIQGILRTHDVILPKPRYSLHSLFRDYCIGNNGEEMKWVAKVIRKSFPEYMDAFNQVMNGNKLYKCNMFIMPRNRFDGYCSWLFDVLFAVEKEFEKMNYHSLKGRTFGYISERLMPVYAYHHRWKVKEYPLYWILDSRKNPSFIQRLRRRIKTETVYFLFNKLPGKHPKDIVEC